MKLFALMDFAVADCVGLVKGDSGVDFCGGWWPSMDRRLIAVARRPIGMGEAVDYDPERNTPDLITVFNTPATPVSPPAP